MSFTDRLLSCPPDRLARYRPWLIDGREVGLVAPEMAAALAARPSVFEVTDEAIRLRPGIEGPKARSAAVNGALRQLAESGDLDDWRDELFPVGTGYGEPPLLHMDRGAVPRMGVRAYGVHLNGTVERADGTHMWIGRRSATKRLSPNKLDQIVAGGQPVGLSLRENLIKESAEEAAIPEALARRAVSVGTISYTMERPEGLRRDVLFNYDLELPGDFRPVNTDGELSDFYLWPLDQVAETVRDTDDFKFNCALVVIDFLIRWGHIDADHPDYEALCKGLRG